MHPYVGYLTSNILTIITFYAKEMKKKKNKTSWSKEVLGITQNSLYNGSYWVSDFVEK